MATASDLQAPPVPANPLCVRPGIIPWTQEEELILRHNFGKVPWTRLQQLLPRRTLAAIKNRAILRRLTRPKEPPWTADSDGFLREHFDQRSNRWIARKLRRSETAVKIRAKRLGLRHRQRPELTPSQIGRMMRICSKQVKRWIVTGLLKARLAPTPIKRIHLVARTDLIDFLKKHPERWDARRCPDLHLRLGLRSHRPGARPGDKPVWLKDKLADDIAHRRQGTRWTPQEDRQLALLMRQGLPYTQIGPLMGRTANSVEHRVVRIGHRIWTLARPDLGPVGLLVAR